MDEAPRVETLPSAGPALAGRLVVGPAPPASFEVALAFEDGRVVAYAARGVAGKVLGPEPLFGNAFRVVHESDATHVALLSIAAARRLETGPESERVILFLRGRGLVFLQNGDTLPFAAGDAALLPAGEPARLWAQGPEDALALVVQPKGERAERRTLAGELAKRRAGGPPTSQANGEGRDD